MAEGGGGPIGGGATEMKVFLEIEGRCVKEVFNPYVGQFELTNVAVKGWIIDPDVYGLVYGPSDVVCLPTD